MNRGLPTSLKPNHMGEVIRRVQVDSSFKRLHSLYGLLAGTPGPDVVHALYLCFGHHNIGDARVAISSPPLMTSSGRHRQLFEL